MDARKTPYNAPAGFDWVVGLESWQLENDTLHVVAQTAGAERAALTFRAESFDIWHMTFIPPDGALDPQTPILSGEVGPALALQVQETERGLIVSGARLALHIDRVPWAIRFLDRDGCAVCRENPTDIDGLGRPFILPLGYVRSPNGVTQVTELFHLRPDEHLFGLGEKFTPLDKTRQRIIAWTQDAFGSTSERSHKNIPFLISTRGYGLLLDSGARITWDLGTVSCQSYTMALDSTALDAWLIYGPTPAEILERFTALTGRSPVPPKWTFGLWVSSGGTYRDQAAMEKLVSGLRENDIPADVVHVDPWWMKWRTYCDFRWDREAFPDVEGFIASLHAQDLRLSLWEHPYISVESDLFEVGQGAGYFLTRPDGEVYIIDYGLSLAPRPDGIVRLATPETSWNARVAIIDVTNPDALAWFQELHRPVLHMGADVFKTDFGEDIPADAVFADGQTARTMHNLYPLLYNRAVYEVTKQERGYGVVWSRSGTAGSQRYPICWSADPAADFDSLACTIWGGLSVGLSGVPLWSNDIGAYRGRPSPRLFVRWAQFGLFCSHSRMHGDSPREPWFFGEEALAIVRRYIYLRYQLFPYLYSTAHQASQTGLPVIRAMPLAFPQDANTYDKDLQYMLGPWLLVAPIYDEGETRSVYLPEGRWIDYWNGEVYEGQANIQVHAPLDTLPLFVRAGAIIPMMPPANRIPQGLIDPLIVEIYPHAQSTYRLYEDEGVTEFTCQENPQGGNAFEMVSERARTLVLRFRRMGQAARITSGAGTGWKPLEDGTLECLLEDVRDIHLEIAR